MKYLIDFWCLRFLMVYFERFRGSCLTCIIKKKRYLLCFMTKTKAVDCQKKRPKTKLCLNCLMIWTGTNQVIPEHYGARVTGVLKIRETWSSIGSYSLHWYLLSVGNFQIFDLVLPLTLISKTIFYFFNRWRWYFFQNAIYCNIENR